MAEALDQDVKTEILKDAKETMDDLDKSPKDRPSASIITFGRPGSGKTSLAHSISDDKTFAGKSGMRPGTVQMFQTSIAVGDVELQVIDTRGMKDATKATKQDEETFDKISRIISNDGTSTNGVLIVCIEMHERVDESTIATLAMLHKRFEVNVWYRAVIALTKADRYEESKWPEPPKRLGRRSMTKAFYKDNFTKKINECKEDLKYYFTREDCKPKCHIGMTSEQFDELDIPIVPTSELTGEAMKRMKKVGQEYWLDELIVSCCQREKGIVLLRLHKYRLCNLPSSLVHKLEQEYLAKDMITNKEFRKVGISKLWFILGPKGYWNRYCKEVSSIPRFELSLRVPTTDHETKKPEN